MVNTIGPVSRQRRLVARKVTRRRNMNDLTPHARRHSHRTAKFHRTRVRTSKPLKLKVHRAQGVRIKFRVENSQPDPYNF